MLKHCTAVLLVLIAHTAVSQLPQFQWAKAFEARNQIPYTVASNGRSVAVDRQGNVYSTGLFTYNTDFDPGPGEYVLAGGPRFDKGIYVSKLSPTGDFVWAFQIPALVEFGNIEITVDHDDNIYVVSELRYPTDFDPGPGVHILTPIGAWDAFVAKYNSNGQLIWAKQFGGPGDTVPRSDMVAVDNNNNVIVCGNFNNTVDFDPGPGTFNITSSAHIQSFIVKLTAAGDFVWAKQFGNAPEVYSGSSIGDVECDAQGNIHLAGTFRGICDFDPGPGVSTLQSTSLRDGYLAKLTPAGDLVWARRIGNTTNDYYQYAELRGLAIDNNNNVYATGDFRGTFDFDPGPGVYAVTAARADWYVLKLNSQGNFAWAAVMGGSEDEVGAHLDVDNMGSLFAIGTIGKVADMDPGPGTFTITTQGIYGASAIVRLTTNGGFISAAPFDGTGSCLTRRMVMDNAQNIYITGATGGNVDFDPGPNVFNVNPGYGQAPYVLKLGKCSNVTTATLNISACSSYTINNQVYDSTGTYYTTLQNTAGCDSIITLHLTINKKKTEQRIAICEGKSFFAGGALQTSPGTYTDTLRSSLNCDSIVTTYLTVHAAPKPDLGADRDLCTGTQSILTPGTFDTYVWQDGSTGASFTASQVGTYYVTVGDARQCEASDTVRIAAIRPAPTAFLPLDTAVCAYGNLLLQPLENFSSYVWNTNATTRAISLSTPGTYWLEVKDRYGCIGRDSIVVAPKECLLGFFMPNGFTPDKNGRNDELKPVIRGLVKQYAFSVYNRWGQLVFHSTQPGKGWDGAINGAAQNAGVFVWVCKYQLQGQEPQVAKGTATLVR